MSEKEKDPIEAELKDGQLEEVAGGDTIERECMNCRYVLPLSEFTLDEKGYMCNWCVQHTPKYYPSLHKF